MQTKPRILVNRLGALGDVILTTPVVRKLFYDHNGLAEITVRTYRGDVYKNNPYVAHVIDGREDFQVSEYDVIFNLDGVYEKNSNLHIIEVYASYVFGDTNIDKRCDLFSSDEDVAAAINLVTQYPEGYIVIHMRRMLDQKYRELPESFWSALVSGILAETNLTIVQIGSLHELAFGGNPRLIDLRGQSLHQVRETISHANCFIGLDSGLSHVADTTKTDMIVFFTVVKQEYVKPFRLEGRFAPIIPPIDCYGCWSEKFPIDSSIPHCFRGDAECTNRFEPRKVIDILHGFTKAA